MIRALAMSGLLTSLALAAEGDAESCLKTKVWEAYGQGWSMRTMAPADLEPGSVKVWKVTAMANRTYQFLGCSDPRITDLDLVVYDAEGKIVTRDSTVDRQPQAELTTERPGTYYLVAHARTVEGGVAPAEVAVAVIWK